MRRIVGKQDALTFVNNKSHLYRGATRYFNILLLEKIRNRIFKKDKQKGGASLTYIQKVNCATCFFCISKVNKKIIACVMNFYNENND